MELLDGEMEHTMDPKIEHTMDPKIDDMLTHYISSYERPLA